MTSEEPSSDILARLALVISQRRLCAPDASYVALMYDKGLDAILKKIGEEATETVMAAKDGVPQRVVSEVADLWFHCLLVLSYFGLHPADVLKELSRREGLSGLDEKSQRAIASAADPARGPTTVSAERSS